MFHQPNTSEQSSLLHIGEPDTEAEKDVNCCDKLTSWRSTDGRVADRLTYKVLCSVLLISEFLLLAYVYYSHGDKSLLVIFTLFTMFKFLSEVWGQETGNWVCPGNPILFVVVYVIGMPSVGSSYVVCMSNPNINNMVGIIPRDILGTILFLSGTIYSWSYELLRFRWKKDPVNKGRLHTIQHARFHIHPNYFGDLFTYSGWALVVGTTCSLSLPISMIYIFIWFVCPNSDAYLASRYREEFPAYSGKTATLIPFVTSRLANHCLAVLALLLSIYFYPSCGQSCGN